MTAIHLDFLDLLRCFNSNGVRYLLVGGYAVNFHGYHRNTQDIDLWIAAVPANLKRAGAALEQFGFSDASAAPLRHAKLGEMFTFGREPLRVDILTSPSGIAFEPCWKRRVRKKFGDVAVNVVSLKDLLANKIASARDKDVADAHELAGTASRRRRQAVAKKRRQRKQK